MFTKVNRGGFREIRTGGGRTVKTRTDARGVEQFHGQQRTKLLGNGLVVTKSGTSEIRR